MIDRIQKWLPRIALHALLLGLPLLFSASSDELFEFPKILLVYSCALLLLGAWILRAIQVKRLTIPRTAFDYPIAAFLASQIISTLFSINHHTSLYGYYSRFNGGLFSVFSYVIIYYAVTLFCTKKTLPILWRSLFIGGILTALYAFPEHFGHSPSCLLITGKFTADCWIQDVQTRIFGTLGQPNWLAAYMVVLLPLTVSQLINSAQKTQKKYQYLSIWGGVFLLFSLVLFYTKSRSGILGAGVALAVQSIGMVFLYWKNKSTQAGQFFVTPLLLATFCLLLLFIPNPVRDKLEQLIHLPSLNAPTTLNLPPKTSPSGTQLDTGGSESGDIRKVVWSGAVKVWLRYPLFGSGVETFAYSYYKDRPKEHNLLSEWDFLYNKAHNEFLNYLATTGAVGLLTYVTMVGSFIALPMIWALQRKKPVIVSAQKKYQVVLEEEESVSPAVNSEFIAISCALIGLSISNFFGFSTVVVSLLTFALPAFAVVLAGKERFQVVSLERLLRKKIVSNVTTAIVCIVICYLLLGIWNVFRVDVSYSQSKAMIDHSQVQEGVALLQDVINRAPNEPVYRDELAYTAARLSYAVGTTGDSTSAAQLAQAAIDNSDEVLSQNSVNVNFYKTRARIFTLLGQISPVFYTQAISTLEKARELSPTDPKLTYNLALIATAMGKPDDYERYLKETIALRPIDLQARTDLALLYETQKKVDAAKAEYTQVLQYDPANKVAKDHIASLSAVKK